MGLEEIVAELERAERILVVTHHNADLDSACPAIVLQHALRQKGKHADVGAAESVAKGVRRIIEGHEVKIDPLTEGYDLIVSVDAASPEQLEPIKFDYKKLVVIDHHAPGALAERARAAYVDPTSRSCTQIVLKIVNELGAEVTPEMAKLLIGGIVGDTAYLRFADVGIFQTLIGLLERSGMKYSEILDLIGAEQELSERIATIKSAARMKAYQVGEEIVIFSTAGSFEAATARALLKLGADVAIVAVPKKDAVRISGRMDWSLRERLNLATDIFKPCEKIIGGNAGGHDAAASANGTKPENIKTVFAEMLKLLENKLGAKAREL